MRWEYRDPPLAWLLVAAYGAHIVEEWVGGFPEWVALLAGAPLPRDAFIVINAAGMAGMVAATHGATRHARLGWMAIAIAALLFANGALHLVGSIATGSYSPGLFTGVILYLPLGQLALMRAWQQAPDGFLARGVLAGLGVHALVSLIAFALAR
jgi:hypothetical protein